MCISGNLPARGNQVLVVQSGGPEGESKSFKFTGDLQTEHLIEKRLGGLGMPIRRSNLGPIQR